MTLSKELAKQAKKKGICKEWHTRLKSMTDRQAMVEMYLHGIDFCLKNDYPGNDFIKAHFGDIAPLNGVFVDSHIDVENRPKCVCLGATFGKVKADGFNVCEIFAKHDVEINVIAADNAFVVVDVFDNAVVNVHAHDQAKVYLNKYGGDCTINVIIRESETHVKIRMKSSKSY